MKNAEDKELTEASGNLLMRHLKSFQENDIEAILNDYSEQSVLITTKKTYRGISEIREFFIGLIVDFPKQNSKLELDIMAVHNDLIFIVWHAKTPGIKIILGTDTLIIKDNKIWQQTFVDMVKFVN